MTAYDNQNQEYITKLFKSINHVPNNSRNTLIFGHKRVSYNIQAFETEG